MFSKISKMMTWDQLMDINVKPYRKPIIEEEYKLFRKNKINTDYIINELLIDKNKDLHLTVNKYPYYIEENVLHLIIWDLNSDKNNKKNISRYKKFVKKFFNLKNFDIIMRINKNEHQSIPEIKHCHLFLRFKK